MITDVMIEDNQPRYFLDHFKIDKSKLKNLFVNGVFICLTALQVLGQKELMLCNLN